MKFRFENKDGEVLGVGNIDPLRQAQSICGLFGASATIARQFVGVDSGEEELFEGDIVVDDYDKRYEAFNDKGVPSLRTKSSVIPMYQVCWKIWRRK